MKWIPVHSFTMIITFVQYDGFEGLCRPIELSAGMGNLFVTHQCRLWTFMCYYYNNYQYARLDISLCSLINFPNHYIATNKLVVPSNAQCACPDDVLTFTCTVVGPGNTIWSGTAFNCPSTSNEIILRHSQFASPGTSGNCNSGTITARSLGVENDCFRSELNVTASASLNKKTVQCQHNSIASGTIPVSETAVTVTSGIGEM